MCSSDLFQLVLNTGYRMGISQIYWDKNFCMAKVKPRPLLNTFVLLTLCAFESAFTTTFVRRLMTGGRQMLGNLFFMQAGNVVTSGGLGIFMILHTHVRKYELVGVINGLLSVWVEFTGK